MNIKDYLHLYLGCSAMFDNRIWKINKIGAGIVRLIRRDGSYGKWVECHYEDCQLILRPLSSMTEDEKKELDAIEKNGSSYPTVAYALAPCFAWLLSKHFDLFGLIDAGLAIDKTKLTEAKV
jgi:hypothetical protein